MNHFGINLWNWCAGMDAQCLGKPTRAAELGFTAVELPMTVPTVPPALAQEIRGTGLAVTLCAALGPGRDLSNEDSAVRASTMAYLTECLKTGAALGVGGAVASAAGFWAAIPVTMGVRALFDRYRSRALTGMRVQGRINRLKELNAALRRTEQPVPAPAEMGDMLPAAQAVATVESC